MNYTREEAEEMANKYAQTQWHKDQWPEYHDNCFDDYLAGRMSLADKCKELEADNERLREALEELVELKKMKFNDGEYTSEEYMRRNPIAWDNAKKLINPTQLFSAVGRRGQLLAFAKHLQPKEDVSLLMNEVNVFIHESK